MLRTPSRNLYLHQHYARMAYQQHRNDPELIFSPDGSKILSLNIGRHVSSSRIEPPSRPRMRHDPSLVDATSPPLPLEEEHDPGEAPRIHRKNPCCLCKVGFYHGALNFGIISTGLHFFLMLYCIYVALFTKEYTISFFQFWGVLSNWDEADDGDTQHLMKEIHIIGLIGSITEGIGCVVGFGLIYGILKGGANWCYLWCTIQMVILSFEVFGICYLASRVSFLILIPLPFAMMIQTYGYWVIIAYIQALNDPKECPICHHLMQEAVEPPSDHSLPTSVFEESASDSTVAPSGTDRSYSAVTTLWDEESSKSRTSSPPIDVTIHNV